MKNKDCDRSSTVEYRPAKSMMIGFKSHRSLMFKYIEKGFVCAEIGVWKGYNLDLILERGPGELHLIDPWLSDMRVPGRWYAIPQEEMDEIYNSVIKRFNRKNIFIHRKTSEEASREFDDNYFDWVYIDGNHSYEYVKKDLNCWYPKVKGILCGDDYVVSEKLQFGVIEAVDEFVKERDLELSVFNKQFVIKRGIVQR